MKFYLNILMLITLAVNLNACSGSKSDKNKNNAPEKTTKESKIKNISLFNDETKPFYTVDPKLEEIESEIALLKEQVIQYQSQISTPNFNTEVLKLLKNPGIKHEIQLSNGTTIQGVIIYENVDQLIVETQIGQLQINKNEVINTEDILPPLANLEFVGDAIEEVYQNKRAYKGAIKNNGLKRADFARVIYTLHDENSNLIATDSAFVSGSKYIYSSGIISDASINPGDFAEFYVNINVNTDKEIKYFLRDIRWEYFE
ncbi:MAG: hypothetical protein CBE06_000250 [Pelagibacteraceae bacterium TMED246]|nr:MAG: hypothetical protein CBE06_000250 [Pelagibacteraceae bacterium TMED246]|tara:strand:- start:61291 stop:62064 length:774 start_codon:yes stop_codon:yes gene_type:complete